MMDKSKKKRDLINSSASSSRSTPASRSQDASSRSSTLKSATTSTNTSVNNSQNDLFNGHNSPNTQNIVMGYDLRAHLAQIMRMSDDDDDLYSSEDDCSIESFDDKDDRDEELTKLALEGPVEGQTRTPLPTGLNNCQSLVPISEDADEDLDSEEENEIMREIRNEITNNMRQEMKSELELYQAKMKKLEKDADGGNAEAGADGGETGSGGTGKYADLDNLDPKLRTAIIKMRKLDIILKKRVKKEKQVKRDRILLERRLRREIEEIHKEKKDEYKEVTNNEQKFLALELPSRHNEDYGIEYSLIENCTISETPFLTSLDRDKCQSSAICETPVTPNPSPCLSEIVLDLGEFGEGSSSNIGGVTVPDEFTGEEVFATQLNEDDYPGLSSHRDKGRKGASRGSHKTQGGDSERTGSDDESRGDASSVLSGSVDGKKHGKGRKKDFIKRNKELAADASNVIAMTDEEKKRLDDLLQDVDTIPEIAQTMELDEVNPFQLAVKPGDGFVPEEGDLRTLTSIDSRLKELIPPEDYESIASSSLSHVPKNKLFTHTGIKHEVDWEQRGERALFQAAEQREMNDRLAAIEQELAKIKNPDELELETPHLDEDQLHELIDQCVTSLSQTSFSRMTLNSESRTSFADTESIASHNIDGIVDDTPRSLSPRSARQEILDHPPKLAPDVLQKLLSEAYHPLSKHLSTLKEEDDEEDEGTPIPSEVWKLISMETVDESQSTKTSMDTDTLVSVSQSLTDTDNTYDTSTDFTKHDLPMSGHVTNNQTSARNGFRNLSRNSSASSLASVSDLGKDSRDKPLKLPEIDPTGTLVTQGLNSQRRSGSGSSLRTPVNHVRNSQSDSRMDSVGGVDSRIELLSLDGELMSPHPPAKEKREGSGSKREGSGSKSRTASRTNAS